MGIRITAKRDGFRRCGFAHSAAGHTFPDAFFTPEQLVELKAEPQLVVVEGVELDLEQDGGDEQAGTNLELSSGAKAPQVSATKPAKPKAAPAKAKPAAGAAAPVAKAAAKPAASAANPAEGAQEDQGGSDSNDQGQQE